MVSCGAGRIEDFGENFLKSVNGSYTTILGLPMFELRRALKEIGFKY
jgi:predicted house-cleaning NTP pyrophosphatase (Maf/HAM1 superfamily)